MQNYVFVIDQNKQPLNPISPKRARELLTKQKAAVFRMYPFTIILKHAVLKPAPKPLTIKLDPGSKVTGIAIIEGENVIWAAELEHRGGIIKNSFEEFLKKDSSRLEKIKQQALMPLKDATAVNATRWSLFHSLKNLLPTTTGTGGQTKYNRTRLELDKQHWIDAACVGDIEIIRLLTSQPLRIKCTGWGTRQMCGTDKYGFPTRHRERKQVHFGLRTGDIVKAVVTSGKKIGEYVGRVLCRKTGSFDIATTTGRVTGISHRYVAPIHKKDGYSYGF